MRINADFTRSSLVRYDANDWTASPGAGVHRRMLDRIGDEVARATTIVRFDPGSAFAAHTHAGGEEYLVLDGTFQDESGDFPTGSYVRNPPTTSHRPAAATGATILVKLHQFDPADRTPVHINSAQAKWSAVVVGVDALALHDDPREQVFMERWTPDTSRSLDASGGLEIFVMSGTLSTGADTLGRWDWLRLPVGSGFAATAGPDGVQVWVKTGHLRTIIGAST